MLHWRFLLHDTNTDRHTSVLNVLGQFALDWGIKKLYHKCFTKEALDGLGDFNIGGQIIQTVKYADDLVLMAKEETVLQDMIDKLIEIGSWYGMEMNVEKTN